MEDDKYMEELRKNVFDLHARIGETCNGIQSRAVMAALLLLVSDIYDQQNISESDFAELFAEARHNHKIMKEMEKKCEKPA